MLDAFLEMLLLTLVPWIELRGSIPYGIAHGLDPFIVFACCVTMNILLLLPLFVFLDHVFPLIQHWKLVDVIVKRTRRKSKKYVERWGFLGLVILVAIPLPGTGAYTGSLAAKLFGFKKAQAFEAISLGVAIAGVIVLLVSLFFREVLLPPVL